MTTPGAAPLVELIPNRAYASRRDVIEAIGRVMVASAAVAPAYVEGMLRKEDQGTTMVTADIALPHGTNDVKHAVRRNAIVIVPIRDGVEWTPGRRVSLAIGFAGTGDDGHLKMLGTVARVLSDEQLVKRLKGAIDPHDVADLLEELVT